MLASQFDITAIHTQALLVNVRMTSEIDTVLQGVASARNTGCLWGGGEEEEASSQPVTGWCFYSRSYAVWIVRSAGSHGSVVGALAT